LFIGCITTSSKNDKQLWLGDTGDQCHVRMTEESDRTSLSTQTVKMGNNSSASVLYRENLIIEDDLGSKINLNNTRVVKGMKTNVISLLQLMEEGWDIKPIVKNKNKIIQTTIGNNRIIFEKRNRKKYVFYLHQLQKAI